VFSCVKFSSATNYFPVCLLRKRKLAIAMLWLLKCKLVAPRTHQLHCFLGWKVYELLFLVFLIISSEVLSLATVYRFASENLWE